MKVLLCCAGGLSSSILMKKMKTWADAHGEDLEIQAMGTGEAVETWQNGYECVLLAPQVSYRLKQLQEEIKLHGYVPQPAQGASGRRLERYPRGR